MTHRHSLLIVLALGLGGCTGADFNGGSSSSRDSSSPESAHAHHADGDTNRVMGSVDIGAGEHAVVGKVETGNGGITVEQHATAGDVETVNGGIRGNGGAGISGTVQTV